MIPIAQPLIGEEEQTAVHEVLESGMLASGNIVRAFEEEFADYLGIEHCITTTSGTTALEVALRALGIGPGDKVLTTPFSFIASTNSIVYTGATPVFADIRPDTFNIDPEKIEAALRADSDIKALLIVHLFGQACNMDQIIPLVEKYHLLLIEDCAQSHGAMWKGKPVGTFGNVGCFSFYPTKNMTTGEGGAIVTHDANLAETCRLLINHGMAVRYHHDLIGYNYRMTNIAAAIGRCQLRKLDRFNQIRRLNGAILTEGIHHSDITTPFVQDDAFFVYHQYTLRIKNDKRDQFTDYLNANNIGYGIFYPLSIPEQKCYQRFGFNTVWPVTDLIKNQVVSIPVHPGLSEEDLDMIVQVVNKFQ